MRLHRTLMSSASPKILRLGKVVYAQDRWNQLSKKTTIVELSATTREEFFRELDSGKFDGVECITRTFASIEQTGRFDAELVSHLPKLVKTVSHCGAGYDQVDPEPLTKRGIQLSNVTEPVERPTADTAIYLTLSCLRNYQIGHDHMRQWPQSPFGGAPIGRLPESKVVGILGMGGIGRAIKDRLKPFGFSKLQYHNRTRLLEDLEDGVEYVSQDELLATSDVLMISIPLNPKTRHLINREAFEKMKDGVIIINTARGAIIDEQEIIAQLKAGKVGLFGADVFEHEPKVAEELIDMPQVVSLPHMGTWSVDAIKNMELWVVDNIECYLETGKLKTIVPEQANAF